jgi:hypothetical protein
MQYIKVIRKKKEPVRLDTVSPEYICYLNIKKPYYPEG